MAARGVERSNQLNIKNYFEKCDIKGDNKLMEVEDDDSNLKLL